MLIFYLTRSPEEIAMFEDYLQHRREVDGAVMYSLWWVSAYLSAFIGLAAFAAVAILVATMLGSAWLEGVSAPLWILAFIAMPFALYASVKGAIACSMNLFDAWHERRCDRLRK